jgi:hypothetical protein
MDIGTPLGTAVVKTVRSEAGKSTESVGELNFVGDIAPVAVVISIRRGGKFIVGASALSHGDHDIGDHDIRPANSSSM